VSRREIIGFAAIACVACCIGPMLGVLGSIAALGAVSTVFIGVAGFALALAAIATFIVVRRRRANSCATDTDPVAIKLTRSAP
jgi:hypothetical protein